MFTIIRLHKRQTLVVNGLNWTVQCAMYACSWIHVKLRLSGWQSYWMVDDHTMLSLLKLATEAMRDLSHISTFRSFTFTCGEGDHKSGHPALRPLHGPSAQQHSGHSTKLCVLVHLRDLVAQW